MSNRRQFLKSIPIVAAAGAVMSMSDLALAAPMVAETDPQAAALGYKADTTKVDKAKFPKHAADQHCHSDERHRQTEQSELRPHLQRPP